MWKHLVQPSTIDEAVQLLGQYGERARVIAGGTDVLLEIERGVRKGIEWLIDISRIRELQTIVDQDATNHLGAGITHNQVVAHEGLRATAWPLVQACWSVGAPQIRNRATVAGNLITGSPANDTIVPLMAMGASVTLRSVDGVRSVPLAEFYTGLRRTVMQPGELLTHIHVPKLAADQHGMFFKYGLRQAQAIAVVNAGIVLTMEQGRVSDASICLGSVAPTIFHARRAEDTLRGQRLDRDTIRNAAIAASAEPSPIDDVRGSAAFRVEMLKVVVARALEAIAAGRDRELVEYPAMLYGATGGYAPQIAATVTHEPVDTIVARVNGQPVTTTGRTDKTLLDWLREDVGLTGTKEGCAEGECGACTVDLDGIAVMSCLVPAARAHGASIVTVEGLADAGELHPVQRGFIEAGAVQCGYCTPGLLMSGAMLLQEFERPTVAQIQQSISGNLCRCTGYYKIIEAIELAAASGSKEG
jgi:xanthine dehydrogenase iron-sulfur cluster and FAD-binding subunit A